MNSTSISVTSFQHASRCLPDERTLADSRRLRAAARRSLRLPRLVAPPRLRPRYGS